MFDPQHRLLIVVEAFAYHERRDGIAKRNWFGFEDRPITG